MSMKRALVKKTPADRQGRYNSEKPLIVPKPALGVSQAAAGREFAGQDRALIGGGTSNLPAAQYSHGA